VNKFEYNCKTGEIQVLHSCHPTIYVLPKPLCDKSPFNIWNAPGMMYGNMGLPQYGQPFGGYALPPQFPRPAMAGMMGAFGQPAFTGQTGMGVPPAAGGKNGGAFSPEALDGVPSGPKSTQPGLLPTKGGTSWADQMNDQAGKTTAGGGDKTAPTEEKKKEEETTAPTLSKNARKRARRKERAVGLRTEPVTVGPIDEPKKKTADNGLKPKAKPVLSLVQRLTSAKKRQLLTKKRGEDSLTSAQSEYELKVQKADEQLQENLLKAKENYKESVRKANGFHEAMKKVAADGLAKAKKRQMEEDEKLAAELYSLEHEEEEEEDDGDDAVSIGSNGLSMAEDNPDASALANQMSGTSFTHQEEMEDAENQEKKL
jgi:hypothetical protein